MQNMSILSSSIQTPKSARLFSFRQDLLKRDIHFFSHNHYLVLFVERTSSKWCIYSKKDKEKAIYVFFDNEFKAMAAWHKYKDGNSILEIDKVKIK